MAIKNTVRVASIEVAGVLPIVCSRVVRRRLAAPLASVHGPLTRLAAPGNHRAPTPAGRPESISTPTPSFDVGRPHALGMARARMVHDVRALIRDMSAANPLWGAPGIHGELLKLGIAASESTVAKYLRRNPRPPSQLSRVAVRCCGRWHPKMSSAARGEESHAGCEAAVETESPVFHIDLSLEKRLDLQSYRLFDSHS